MPTAPRRHAARWLQEELADLVAGGTINEDSAQAIARYYAAKAPPSRNFGFLLLSVVGSALVAAGIILLVAHNWDEFSRPVRSAIAFFPLIATQLLGLAVLARREQSQSWRECVAIFNVAAVGAAISLVSQTYRDGIFPAAAA